MALRTSAADAFDVYRQPVDFLNSVTKKKKKTYKDINPLEIFSNI